MDNATFDTIIIPYDGSEPAALAFLYAEWLPSRAMRLVRVEPPFQVLAPGPLENFRPDWREVRAAQVAEELEPVAERFRRRGRDIEIVVRFGDPAEEILTAAAGADLIVMTTQGRGTTGRALFGSVADRVCRHADTPTLLVRAAAAQAVRPQFAQIVVPLDGSPLAERALPPATALAACLGLSVRLLRIVDPAESPEDIPLGRQGLGAGATTDGRIRQVA
jgi:nucleotide-binding universal stress UspA family protein